SAKRHPGAGRDGGGGPHGGDGSAAGIADPGGGARMTVFVFEKARIVDPSRDIDETGTVIVKDGKVKAAGADALNQGHPEGATVRDCSGLAIMPGLVDAHVHVGEPGAEHRETIASASQA